MEDARLKYKAKKRKLKEDLELSKEQVLKLQRTNMERDLYKGMADENFKLKARVGELEA